MDNASPGECGKAMLLLAKCQLGQLHNSPRQVSAQVRCAVLKQVLSTLEAANRHLSQSIGEHGSSDAQVEVHYLITRVLGSLPLTSNILKRRDELSSLFIHSLAARS